MSDQPPIDQLAEIHMAAKRLRSEIPSPDSGRIDNWIDQISSVYNRLQHIAVDGDASSEQVGLAMDAREILANALADAIWLRPSDLTLLVMLRELHYLYQEDNVRFALARALATCEPCPQWVSDLVVTDPNQLKEYMKTLDESRVAELRELYSDYQEQEVFEQLLRVAPDAKPNIG